MAVDLAELGLSVDSEGFVRATSRMRDYEKAAATAESATERMARRADQMGQSMMRMGRMMSLRVTVPIVAFAGAAVRAFGNFDDAMVSSLAIMGDVSDAMRKDMSDAAREVGRTTVFSATQAAESYFFLASAGLDAAASIAALPRVAKFAQAGNFDMARATDILTDAQSALGRVMEDPIENMREMTALSDVLVKANTVANASVEQFGEALTNKAGAAMRQLNIEVETGVAVLAAWADQGVKGAAAGERFNIVTRDLQTAIRNNREEFERFGVSVFDSQGNLRNLADIIENLEGVLGSMSVEQQGATLSLLGFQDRSVQAIRSLIGLSGQIKDYEKDLQSAGGTTDEVANKQLESFNKQMGLLKDEIVDIAIEIGGSLVPVIKDLRENADSALQSLRDWAEWFSEADDATKKLVIGLVGLLAVSGPVLIFLGAVVRALQTLLPLLIATGGRMTGIAGAFAFLGFKIAGGLKDFRSFEERAYGVRDALDSASESVERFSEAHQRMLNQMHELPSTLSAVEAEIAKLETQHRRFVRQYGEESVAAEGVRLKLEDLRQQYIRLGGTIEETDLSPPASAAAFSQEFEQSLNRLAATLRGEVAVAQLEYNELLEESNRRRAAGEISVGQLARAHALARDQLRQAIDLTSEYNDALDALAAELAGPSAIAARDFGQKIHQLNVDFSSGRIGLETFTRGLALFSRQYALAMSNLASQAARPRRVFQDLRDDLVSLIAAHKGGAAAMREYNKEAFIAGEIAKLVKEGNDEWEEQVRIIRDLADALFEVSNKADDMSLSFMRAADAASSILRAAQQFAGQGTKEFQAMQIAVDALALTQGIAAILNQGQGDPYTAPARMAAMAAAIAPLIANLSGSIGSFGGGFSATAERRQATQGTGSVLGDADAKTESIIRSSEITANATSALVGINRGMLRALQALQAGIGGASGMLARGAGRVDFSQMGLDASGSFADAIGIGFASRFLDPLGILGGSSKITDEGILIIGDTFGNLIENVMAGAYQEVQSRSWRFGRKRTREGFEMFEGPILDQFSLIFGSIADAVFEGAVALGLSADEVEQAIANFQVGDIRISLLDLNAEEQQAELNAVFGEIFDGLAGHVVPWIAQFQKVGEGLGETLIRVATGVQVTQEAMRRLGFALDETDPEKFAQISEALIEMAGGLDEFIEGIVGFFDKFAPDTVKMAVAQDDLTRAFEQYGLVLPDTREGMWELMQSLDATTEAGRAQIAMLLEMTDVADAYYRGLEKVATEREGLERRLLELQGDTVALRELEIEKLDESNRALQRRIWAIEDQMALDDLMDDVRRQALEIIAPARLEWLNLNRAIQQTIDRAKELGASEEDLMLIRGLAEMQIRMFTASLEETLRRLNDKLTGRQNTPAQQFNETADAIDHAARRLRDAFISALESVDAWLDRSLLGNVSPLTPEERLVEAQRQFDEAFAAAMAGDVGAIASLPGLADALLGEGGSFFGTTTSDFQALWDSVRAAMEQVAALEPPPEPPEPPTAAQQQQIVDATQDTALSGWDQLQTALQMLDVIGLIATLSGDAPHLIADAFGLDIAELIGIVTGEVPDLTGDALAEYFDELVFESNRQLNELARIEDVLDWQRELQSELVDRAIEQVDLLRQIRTYLATIANETPEFHDGGPVRQTGFARVQRGEFVIPRDGTVVRQDPHTNAALEALNGRVDRLAALTEAGNAQRAAHISVTSTSGEKMSIKLSELAREERQKRVSPRAAERLKD